MSGAALAAGLLTGVGVRLWAGPSSWSRLRRCLGAASVGGASVSVSVLPVPVPPVPVSVPVPVPVPVPVVIDLVAAVVEAGAPPGGAIDLVSRCLVDAGDPGGRELRSAATVATSAAAGGRARAGASGEPDACWRPLFTALELAESCGLGPVGLLRSAAGEQRRGRAEALAVAARRLAVLVVLPTTLCLLPAFVVLTVVPLVLDLLPAV